MWLVRELQRDSIVHSHQRCVSHGLGETLEGGPGDSPPAHLKLMWVSKSACAKKGKHHAKEIVRWMQKMRLSLC